MLEALRLPAKVTLKVDGHSSDGVFLHADNVDGERYTDHGGVMRVSRFEFKFGDETYRTPADAERGITGRKRSSRGGWNCIFDGATDRPLSEFLTRNGGPGFVNGLEGGQRVEIPSTRPVTKRKRQKGAAGAGTQTTIVIVRGRDNRFTLEDVAMAVRSLPDDEWPREVKLYIEQSVDGYLRTVRGARKSLALESRGRIVEGGVPGTVLASALQRATADMGDGVSSE